MAAPKRLIPFLQEKGGIGQSFASPVTEADTVHVDNRATGGSTVSPSLLNLVVPNCRTLSSIRLHSLCHFTGSRPALRLHRRTQPRLGSPHWNTLLHLSVSKPSTRPTMNHPTPSSPPESTKVERLTYSVDESAQALGVSKPTVYRLLARRILVPIAGLRHKRIPCQQVRRLASTPESSGRN